MKAENILNALGDVKDEYLADAEKAGAGRTKKQYWLKLGAAAACLCLIAGGIFAVPRMVKEPKELEKEMESEGTVSDTETKESVSLIGEELDAAFGYLFPTEIEKGYVPEQDGIEVYGDSPRVLRAAYRNEELNDTLHIVIAPSGYFGEVETGTVLYGDRKTDGTRSSMIYYENGGMTVLYQFDRTDIAALDGENSERLYAMIHSAGCFNRPADGGEEQNDDFDIETLDLTGVQRWSPDMGAADYFANSGKEEGSDSDSAYADLIMRPSAVMVPLEDRREEFEADGILPRMEDRTEYDFCAEYNGDGSLYKLTFLWMRRGDNAEYSDLTLTAAPKEPHEVNCYAVAEGVGGGQVPPYVTVTERDGILICAKGRENQEKTLTWQTEAGWFEIRGSFNDSYEDTAALLDWFWEHPLDLALFADPPEGSMIFSTRAEHPEAFQNQIPDFEALGYAAESELVNLGEHWGETVPVWFEGIYSRGDTRIRWSVSLGADRDAWDACLGRPGEFAEDQLTEALKDRDFVNIFFDRTKEPPLPIMATAKLENGSAADLWEVIKSLEN